VSAAIYKLSAAYGKQVRQREATVMNAISRFLLEYNRLWKVLNAKEFCYLLAYSFYLSPTLLRDRKLVAIDKAMSHDMRVKYRGQTIDIPCRAVDEILPSADESPTFGTIREMMANDVYFQAFTQLPMGGTVLDLGSNRGVFAIIAKKMMSAKTVVGVEPQAKYVMVNDMLSKANGIVLESNAREVAFIASNPGPDKITIAQIMKKYAISEIDFMKCDIEGGEYDIFLNNNTWIEKLNNLAMEVHDNWAMEKLDNTRGNEAIARVLEQKGLAVRGTDQFGAQVPFGQARYLYAARNAAWLK
jgi:hypothetical protein